jgi:hypothetical protein
MHELHSVGKLLQGTPKRRGLSRKFVEIAIAQLQEILPGPIPFEELGNVGTPQKKENADLRVLENRLTDLKIQQVQLNTERALFKLKSAAAPRSEHLCLEDVHQWGDSLLESMEDNESKTLAGLQAGRAALRDALENLRSIRLDRQLEQLNAISREDSRTVTTTRETEVSQEPPDFDFGASQISALNGFLRFNEEARQFAGPLKELWLGD